METVNFSIKRFGWWPFWGFKWRGFVRIFTVSANDHEITYLKNDGCRESVRWVVTITELKFFYSEKRLIPWKKPVHVLGSKLPLRIKKVSPSNSATLKQHVIDNGAKLGEISNATFHHAFYFSVIFRPSLWFTSCSIGLGDEGVSFSQKTFKTNDNIFLPYDKINLAMSTGPWYNRTRKLYIYGEQNIIPKKKFGSSNAKRIVNELREKGIGQLEGKEFAESYHSHWFGIVLTIVTLGIWHLIVRTFSKKPKSISIGEDIFSWNGNLWLHYDGNKREKVKEDLKFFAGKINEIVDIYYYKKHWYHLWGYVFLWVRPFNIRELAYKEGHQSARCYEIQMGKVFSLTAKEIKKNLKEKGFKKGSNGNGISKKYVKRVIKGE